MSRRLGAKQSPARVQMVSSEDFAGKLLSPEQRVQALREKLPARLKQLATLTALEGQDGFPGRLPLVVSSCLTLRLLSRSGVPLQMIKPSLNAGIINVYCVFSLSVPVSVCKQSGC